MISFSMPFAYSRRRFLVEVRPARPKAPYLEKVSLVTQGIPGQVLRHFSWQKNFRLDFHWLTQTFAFIESRRRLLLSTTWQVHGQTAKSRLSRRSAEFSGFGLHSDKCHNSYFVLRISYLTLVRRSILKFNGHPKLHEGGGTCPLDLSQLRPPIRTGVAKSSWMFLVWSHLQISCTPHPHHCLRQGIRDILCSLVDFSNMATRPN